MVKQAPNPKRKPHKQFFRQWREKLELTQDRALERLESWSQSKLSRIESGKIMWNGYDLADLEEAYGVTSDQLLNVDPFMDGEVIDLVRIIKERDSDLLRHLKDKDPDQIVRMLRAL